MLTPKSPQQEQGFTLVEVLVAILLMTVFVTVAMQAIVIAAVFKAHARQFSEATIWIQKELEIVRSEATINELPHVNDNPSTPTDEEKEKCGTSNTSTPSNGYAAALQSNLTTLNSANSATINSKIYTAIANTTNAPNPRTVGGAKLWLLRNATNTSTAPYNVLQISYAVVRDVNGSPSTSYLAITDSEVIPDAAFSCP